MCHRRQPEAGRLQEAEETAQLWDILCGVLDQFMEILGEEPMDIEEFTRLFRQVLTQYSVGSIPVSLDQVSVTGVARNDRHSGRCYFLLGANDHVLPTPGEGGGILNEDDREELSKHGVSCLPPVWTKWASNCKTSMPPWPSPPTASPSVIPSRTSPAEPSAPRLSSAVY